MDEQGLLTRAEKLNAKLSPRARLIREALRLKLHEIGLPSKQNQQQAEPEAKNEVR
jgi:hypothetical protein